MKPEAVEEAAGLLGEVRGILRDQPNMEDGLRVAFCLEEIVSESKSAISYYHSKKGPHVNRKSAPKRGSSSTDEGTADRTSSAAAGGGDAGESGEEDEEEDELESEVAGGKRAGGDQGVRSGRKRRK